MAEAESAIREKQPAARSPPSPAAAAAAASSSSPSGPSAPSVELPAQPTPAATRGDASTDAAAVAASAFPAVAPEIQSEPDKTFMQRMAGSESYWMWKTGLRVLLCIVDIIGIGCAAAVIARPMSDIFSSSYYYYYDYFSDRDSMPYVLIPLAVSFIWCIIVILVLLLRRPPRPVHPGLAVGVDLILWLAFIVALLFVVSGIYTLNDLGGSSGQNDLEDPGYTYNDGYSGHYTRADNGTWVYQITYVNTYSYAPLSTKTTSSTSDLISFGTGTTTTVITTTTSTGVARRWGHSRREARDLGAVVSSTTVLTATASAATATATSTSSYDPYYDDYYTDSYDDYYTETDSYDDFWDTYDPYATATDDTSSYDYYYYNYYTTSTTTPTATVSRDCSPTFTSCAQQDKAVNDAWNDRNYRRGPEIAVAVMTGLALLLHFILFVWACIDTNVRNRVKRLRADTVTILQDLRQQGYVMVPADAYMANSGTAGAAGAVHPVYQTSAFTGGPGATWAGGPAPGGAAPGAPAPAGYASGARFA